MAAWAITTSFSELRPTRTVSSRIKCRVPARSPDLRTSHAFRLVGATEGNIAEDGKKEASRRVFVCTPGGVCSSRVQDDHRCGGRHTAAPVDDRAQYSGSMDE